MRSELELTLTRELDEVAGGLVVPDMPVLPGMPGGRGRRRAAPLLVAAAVLVLVLATAWALSTPGRPRGLQPAPSPTPTGQDAVSRAQPEDPFITRGDRLYVTGERVPGQWREVRGRGSHWLGQRTDGSWWWGFDAEPQAMDPTDQPPALSPGAGYTAQVIVNGRGAVLVGADTEYGGEGFGFVDLPGVALDPPPRAVAVTDDGLVVAGGRNFQVMWRPLVDLELVDLAQTAPGQVVLGSTPAGLVVNAGEYGEVDGTQGQPYLARLSPDGVLSPLAQLPTHDVLEASTEWLAYVPAGTVGGEASGTDHLRVQRLDGTGDAVLSPPDGWIFTAPGFRWEGPDRLIALVVTPDGGAEAMVRCRPERPTCVRVELP